MNEQEWDRMRTAEEGLWWYKALHRALLRLLPSENKTKKAIVLDAGCGTGGFMTKLAHEGYQVAGLDMSPAGIRHTYNRGFTSVLVASANVFPFDDDSFDLVTCLDVLESESVIPKQVIEETWRVLKPGGYGLFQMAAHQWLLSEHDRAVHSVRRFSKHQFLALFEKANFEIVYATYLFFLLFPLMALWKLMHPPKKNLLRESAVSDVRLPASYLNQLLYAICLPESILVPRIALPIGTSVCTLVKKHE
jgi:SAM-dependent methyltransferase